ncbi:MAG: glycosyltransferase [Erysipelotrichaceae bacterium]
MNLFIGEFPPPYGGVTIKCNNLIRDVFINTKELKIVNLFECKRNKIKLFNLINNIVKAKKHNWNIIIATDSENMVYLLKIIKIICGTLFLKKVSVFMMGGTFQNVTEKKVAIKNLISKCRVIYTESETINLDFFKQGISNAAYFPNAKSIANSLNPKYRKKNNKKFRCVFFSQISTQKGVRELMKMNTMFTYKEKEDITIDFYGHIVKEIEADFSEFVDLNDNVRYMGVFDAINENVYAKLNEYDVLLFPTLWKTEGIPGIIIEAKLAGIVPIVSNYSFNAEIVKDKYEGVVIEGNLSKVFYEAIQKLYNQNELYNKLAQGSFESRIRYVTEAYAEDIRNTVLSD